MVHGESTIPARVWLVMDSFQRVKCLFCCRCHTQYMSQAIKYLQCCHRSWLKAVLTRLDLHKHHDYVNDWWAVVKLPGCGAIYNTSLMNGPISPQIAGIIISSCCVVFPPAPPSLLWYPVPILVLCTALFLPEQGCLSLLSAQSCLLCSPKSQRKLLCIGGSVGGFWTTKTAAEEGTVVGQGVPITSNRDNFSPRESC